MGLPNLKTGHVYSWEKKAVLNENFLTSRACVALVKMKKTKFVSPVRIAVEYRASC